jgi:ABC-type Fe3+/spermidine/putrescine transport system ATPase subunit
VISKINIPHRKGTPVKFMIRPENVIISNEGKMKGVIARYNYAGTHYDVVISVNNPNNVELQLSAILSGEAELRLNEEIRFDLYIKSSHHVFLD